MQSDHIFVSMETKSRNAGSHCAISSPMPVAPNPLNPLRPTIFQNQNSCRRGLCNAAAAPTTARILRWCLPSSSFSSGISDPKQLIQ
jgi:hypothetical protein